MSEESVVGGSYSQASCSSFRGKQGIPFSKGPHSFIVALLTLPAVLVMSQRTTRIPHPTLMVAPASASNFDFCFYYLLMMLIM